MPPLLDAMIPLVLVAIFWTDTSPLYEFQYGYYHTYNGKGSQSYIIVIGRLHNSRWNHIS